MKKVISILMIIFITALPVPVLGEEDITNEDITTEFIAGAASNKNASFKSDNTEDIGETITEIMYQEGINRSELITEAKNAMESFINGVLTIPEKLNGYFQKLGERLESSSGVKPNGEAEIKETIYPQMIAELKLNYRAQTATNMVSNNAGIVNYRKVGDYLQAYSIENREGEQLNNRYVKGYTANDTKGYGSINEIGQAPWKVLYGTNTTEENKQIRLEKRNDGWQVFIYKYSNLTEDQNNFKARLNAYSNRQGYLKKDNYYQIEGVGTANESLQADFRSNTSNTEYTTTLQPGWSYIAVYINNNNITYDPINTLIIDTWSATSGANIPMVSMLGNYTGSQRIYDTSTKTSTSEELTNYTSGPVNFFIYQDYRQYPVLYVNNETIQENETQFTITTSNTSNTQYKTPEVAYNKNYYQQITSPNTQDANGNEFKQTVLAGLQTSGTTIANYQNEIIDKYTGLKMDLQAINQQDNAYQQWQQENLNTGEQEKVNTLLENENTLHEMTEQNQNTINNWFTNNGIGLNNPFKNFSSSKFLTSANGVKTQLTRMLNTKIGILTEIALILGILALIIGKI